MMAGDLLGPVHVTAAVTALVAGGLVAVARKGTRYHGRVGWMYVGAMFAVNGTALLLYRLTGTVTPFHVAATFSLVTLVAGVMPATRKSPPRIWLWRHATWMTGSYVSLCAAAVAETMTRMRILSFWWAVLSATALTVAVGMAMMSRMIPGSIRRIRGKSRPQPDTFTSS